jgi:hypothetical protein
VRVPLTARADPAHSPRPPTATDVFGIAWGVDRIDTTRPEAPVLEVPTNSLTIVTSRRGKASIDQEELNAEQRRSLPWLVVETQRTLGEPVKPMARRLGPLRRQRELEDGAPVRSVRD